MTVLQFSLIVALGAFAVAELFFVIDVLHASTFIYGLTASTFAVGSLAAAFINERREVSQARLPANVIAGSLMLGLGVLLTGCAWNWVLLFPTVALAGMGLSTLSAYAIALILQRAPDASRGRVSSTVQAVLSFAQITSFVLAGFVVSLIGSRNAILLSGVASILVVAALSSSVLRSVGRNPAEEITQPRLVMDIQLNEAE